MNIVDMSFTPLVKISSLGNLPHKVDDQVVCDNKITTPLV